jgi:hypothetical protein
MLGKVLNKVFGCSHINYSFPLTLRSKRNKAASLTGTYVVCLDCGTEIAYDWQNMTVVHSRSQQRNYTQSVASHHAA